MSLVTSCRLAYRIVPEPLGDPPTLARSLTRHLQSQCGIRRNTLCFFIIQRSFKNTVTNTQSNPLSCDMAPRHWLIDSLRFEGAERLHRHGSSGPSRVCAMAYRFETLHPWRRNTKFLHKVGNPLPL